MRALDEYILMVVFVLLLRRVHFLTNETESVTTQMKALDEFFLIVLFNLLLKRVHLLTFFKIYLNRETWQ